MAARSEGWARARARRRRRTLGSCTPSRVTGASGTARLRVQRCLAFCVYRAGLDECKWTSGSVQSTISMVFCYSIFPRGEGGARAAMPKEGGSARREQIIHEMVQHPHCNPPTVRTVGRCFSSNGKEEPRAREDIHWTVICHLLRSWLNAEAP